MNEKKTKLYWLHAITPLHVGTGTGAGYIDLPIMREKVTGWPLAPGSAVKGVIADACGASEKESRENDNLKRAAFGITDAEGADQANSGALVFTDAHMVCLAVQSLYGTFAWVSSPLALRRLGRDLEFAGGKSVAEPDDVPDADAHLPDADASALVYNRKVYFTDLDFDAKSCQKAAEWATGLANSLFPAGSPWHGLFLQRFAVVSDDTFKFLCETATEVAARVRINASKKIVDKGALWYEEYLPAESVLSGLVWCDRVFNKLGVSQDKIMDKYCQDREQLQIGGKATIGKGQARCLFTDPPAVNGGSNG